MKPVKITAEITVTPEMFIEWCGQDDYLKNEEKYKDYVESWVHSKFSSYGKFFGKYDEYKIRSDGTIVGMAKEGTETVPLYKIALNNFPNPSGLAQVGMLEFLPTEMSGEPIEGTGEIRSGLVELSNVSLKDQVDNLQQAKNLMNISTKMIQQNKALLEEALGLLR